MSPGYRIQYMPKGFFIDVAEHSWLISHRISENPEAVWAVMAAEDQEGARRSKTVSPSIYRSSSRQDGSSRAPGRRARCAGRMSARAKKPHQWALRRTSAQKRATFASIGHPPIAGA